MADYTPEQISDIRDREKKGLQALKDLELTPAAQISKVNVGNDVFADKLAPYLQDTKYSPKPSTDSEVNPHAKED